MQDLFMIYFGIGLLFSVWFSWIKLGQSDPMASKASVGFKLITMPAAMLLWPLLLLKSLHRNEQVSS